MTCICGAPLSGAYLCAKCTHALDVAIANIAAHWTDLDNVRAKLTRYGGAGAQGDRLPIDPRFAAWEWDDQGQAHIPDGTALLDATRNTITTWTRICLDRWPVVHGPLCAGPCLHLTCATTRRSRPPADDVPACCRYLLRWTHRIPAVDWAPDMLDEMTHLEAQLRNLVDRPAERWYAGPCDQCERDLYARSGAAEVTCVECQLDYDVAARRAWLLNAAQDYLVTATVLARAVSWLGAKPLTAERIWQWKHRGRIVVKGHEPDSRQQPLYRIGDAIALLAAETLKVG